MEKQKIFAGIDIGGTSLKVGLFSEDMGLMGRFSTPVGVNDKPEASLIPLVNWLKSPTIAEKGDLMAIGAGIPGIFDHEKGMLTLAANLPQWVGFPVRDYLKEKLGVPVIIGNDGNMAALGEYHAGSGKELESMLMLMLGTGVGGAIIDNGQILEFNGFSGEIGHIIIDIDGVDCQCGHRGCLETMAAKSGLIRMLNEILERTEHGKEAYAKLADITPYDLSNLAKAGDTIAMEVYRKSGHAVGIGVSNILNILRLDGVVIGGGIAGAWDGFFQALIDAVAKNTFSFDPEKIRISKASLGEDAGIFGAGVAAINAKN
jgi:glucokinase